MSFIIREGGPQRLLSWLWACLMMKKMMGLRTRYVLTRENRLRLRYVAGLFFLFSSPLMFGLLGTQSEIVQQPAAFALNLEDMPAPHLLTALDINKTATAPSTDNAQRPILPPLHERLTFKKGDTMGQALARAGIPEQDANNIINSLRPHFNPRLIKAGQSIDLHYTRADDRRNRLFQQLSLTLDPVKTLNVELVSAGDYAARIEEKKVVERVYARKVEINNSLYASAAASGVPPAIIAEMIKAYSWDVDFQRDIQQGDIVEVMYKVYETEDGHLVRNGEFAYANLSLGGRSKPIFRFEMEDGRIDYFKPDGRSLRKTLLTTPIDGARISSGFGMRRHPIMGYNKMHKGVDFAASTGTPIYAAGDAVVDFVGRQNGYGNYIRLRHNGQLKTAYAHMSRFARGINKGTRVRQGQIIGYVGSTGNSTGPHLHYEVLVNNAQVNPRSIDLPTGQMLEGKELKRFKTRVAKVEQEYVMLTESMKLAENNSSGFIR
ncbi:MAG: M23 family metallopeptidase [Alphaproteobacteria bacterium]|nr:M23 family metallopeptidase [Alphaproteobacteria bacterium]